MTGIDTPLTPTTPDGSKSIDAPVEPTVKRLPPFGSLALARKAIESRHPAHTRTVRPGSPTDALLLARYRALRNRLKTDSLVLAQLEIELKERIGSFEGLEVPGEGTLFWSMNRPNKRTRVHWMKLVKALKIPDSTLAQYKEPELKRRFYFKRKVHGSDGIARLQKLNKEVQELDEEF